MRISEAQAKKLFNIKPDGKVTKKRASKSKKDGGPAAASEGRSRHARQAYAAEPFIMNVDLPYDPRPKERPRSALDREVLMKAFIGAAGNLGTFMAMATKGAIHTYTPERTLEYENLLKGEAQAMMLKTRRKPFDIPLEADLVFTLAGDESLWPTSGLDGDGDNLQKAVLDALNTVVFTDDRLIVRKKVEKVCGPRPSVSVVIRPANP
jgi:Holliday junction resolvase RusA-like endonuclease